MDAMNEERILTSQPIDAIRKDGRVEVWDEGRDYCYGLLPEDATGDDADALYLAWLRGYAIGSEFGEKNAQARIIHALGLHLT